MERYFWLECFLLKQFAVNPVLSIFAGCEFGLFIFWGQITAFFVEFSSVLNNAWVYVEGYWWNPTFMYISERPLTIFIQIIWLFASALFYWIAIRLKSED